MTRLSKQQLQQYDSDGIVFPIRVFAPDEVAGYLDELEFHRLMNLGEECSRVIGGLRSAVELNRNK